ncbi:MAG: bifunctional glutamine-synthetase adenylyltransferase/deadenyltransferase, partial [Acidipropionibacterium jensenii]|nr:bifunctional glutamine-synthetase adenylyltransferase/deadenyltransferase [Acidipropionibacterium jensenii]
MDRTTTIAAELARRGAADGPRAAGLHDTIAQVLDAAPGSLAAWEDHLEECADVDMALFSLVDIAEAAPGATAAALSDDAVARRLVRLLGVSSELGRHLASHPEDLHQVVREPVRMPADRIAADLLAEVGAAPDADGFLVAGQDPARQTDPDLGADLLRLANRRHLVRIASRDVDASECAEILDDIAAELADLADAIIETALALARAQTPGHRDARLAVVAMGKCGAQELNYVSDVDVIHIAEPARPDVSTERAVTVAAKLAGTLTRICSARSAAGTIWQVDAALRPEGNAGPLVRTLDSMATYYRNWAKNWEFQALMKARPMAGDPELTRGFLDITTPLVWQVGGRENFMS